MTVPIPPSAGRRSEGERKSAAWWDRFWERPLAATGRRLTCQRTAEEALRLLQPELRQLEPGQTLRVLDLGCGHGDLTPLLLQEPRLCLTALDLSAAALGQFRARLRDGKPGGVHWRRSDANHDGGGVQGRNAPAPTPSPEPTSLPDRLALVRASVYELPFPDAQFDVVVSFGYASAASYAGAEREVARALRPGGVAIIDFVSPSLYRWVAAPQATLRWLQRYRDPAQEQYHFGRRGLATHFGPAGLKLEALRYVNAYPPLERLAGQPWAAGLDRTLSRLAGPLLGRVLVARLRRQPAVPSS